MLSLTEALLAVIFFFNHTAVLNPQRLSWHTTCPLAVSAVSRLVLSLILSLFYCLSSLLIFFFVSIFVVFLYVGQSVHLVEKLLYFFFNWGKEACAFCKNRIIKFVLCFLQLLSVSWKYFCLQYELYSMLCLHYTLAINIIKSLLGYTSNNKSVQF